MILMFSYLMTINMNMLKILMDITEIRLLIVIQYVHLNNIIQYNNSYYLMKISLIVKHISMIRSM